MICILIGYVLANAFSEGSEARKMYVSRSRFDQLEVILQSYHQDHGEFPPVKYQVDPDGPFHSWRVLLLPYLGSHIGRLDNYNFGKHWDSEHNLTAVGTNCPVNFSLKGSGTANMSQFTHFLTIGNDGRWPSE
jgi:hypothetical protein